MPTVPFVSYLFSRWGQITGTPENCRRLLAAEEAMLVFPEGARGISKPFSKRYQLAEFGHGFMRLALETSTPIVPVAVIGAEEQAPAVNVQAARAAACARRRSRSCRIRRSRRSLPLPVKYRLYFGEPMTFTGDPDDDDEVLDEKVKHGQEPDPVDDPPRAARARTCLLVIGRGRDGRARSSSPASRAGSAASSRAASTTRLDWQIVGLDRRPMQGRPKDIEHHQVDLRSKKARDVFRAGDVDALDPPRRDARPACATRRALLVEHHGHDEAARVLPGVPRAQGRGAVVGERLRPAPRQPAVPHRGRAAARRAAVPADARSRRDRSPRLDLLLARARDRDRDPAPGPHPRRRAQRAVELPAPRPRPPTLLGFDPMVQVDPRAGRRRGDRARARARAAAASTTSSVRARCRCRPSCGSSAASRASIPHPFAKPLLSLAFRLGISSFPVAELDFIRYVCMVDGRRAAAELGFRPRSGLRETIRAVDEPA